MFKNILVHIPTERSVRPVVDAAVSLATARQSHLDAIAIGYESMSAAGMMVEGGGAAVAAVGTAEGNGFLATKTHTATAAVTGLNLELGLVDEFHRALTHMSCRAHK